MCAALLGHAAASSAGSNAVKGDNKAIKGIRVASVPGKGWGWGALRENDVITELDGLAVLADGNVEVQPDLLLSFTHILASKHADEDVTVTVIRRGKQLNATCRLGAPGDLLPRFASPSSNSKQVSASSIRNRSSSTQATPSSLFPWPGHLLIDHAAFTTVTLPALEQLGGATASKKAAPPPWHLPGAAAGRSPRRREGTRGQGGGQGELWGGSTLVAVAAGGELVAPAGVLARGPIGVGQASLGRIGEAITSSGRDGNKKWSCACTDREVGEGEEARRGQSLPFLAHHVALEQHASTPGVAQLVMFSEELQSPAVNRPVQESLVRKGQGGYDFREQETMQGRSMNGSGLWPTQPDLLLYVNGTRVLSLQHLSDLCACDGGVDDSGSKRLALEFSSGHLTVLDRLQAAQGARTLAVALKIDPMYLPVN